MYRSGACSASRNWTSFCSASGGRGADAGTAERIERDRKELCGEFCRGCGYCMPCPAGIEINQCARMSLMLRRAPAKEWLTEQWQQKMHRIEECRHCGHCTSKCPLRLNTPGASAGKLQGLLAGSRAEQRRKKRESRQRRNLGP